MGRTAILAGMLVAACAPMAMGQTAAQQQSKMDCEMADPWLNKVTAVGTAEMANDLKTSATNKRTECTDEGARWPNWHSAMLT